MRTIVALAFVMAACGDGPGIDGGGPELGVWLVDTAPVEDWFCVREGSVCAPPIYFTPLPSSVEIRTGGLLNWSGPVQHTGVIEGDCIRVPPATEQGVQRTEATFCNLVVDGVVDEGRAFASIGWSPGAPDACTCSAHFDYQGGE